MTASQRIPRIRVATGRPGRPRARGLRVAELGVLAAVTLIIVAAGCLPTPAGGAPRSMPSRAVRVEHGDTLWSIAREYASDGEGTASAVDTICALNAMDASDHLQEGTFVRVPRREVDDTAVASR